MSNISILLVLLLLRLSYQRDNLTATVVLVLYSSELDFKEEAREELIKSSSEDLWNGTSIRLKFLDSKTLSCSHDDYASVMVVTNFLFHDSAARDVLGIVGPSCSNSAYLVAQIIQRSGVSVKHYYTSPLPIALASKLQETSTGLLPPADLVADAAVALIKHANWSKVFALYQSTDTDFNSIFIRLRNLLGNMDTDRTASTLNYSAPVQDVTQGYFKYIFNNLPIRILFLMADPKLARMTLCTAFNFSATYPKYQWVLLKTTLQDILTVPSSQGTVYHLCKDEDILNILKFSIFIDYDTSNTKKMSDTLLTSNSLYSLSIQAIVARIFSNTSSFVGVSQFPIALSIRQIGANSLVTSTAVFSHNFSLLAANMSSDITYVSSDLAFELRNSNLFVVGINLIAFNSLLLIASLVLHIMTIWYRKAQPVKSSTLPFLHVMYIGFYCINFSLHVYFIQKSFSVSSESYLYFCHIFFLTFPVGSVLVMGTVLMRTWRLYRIFVHFRNPGKFLSNYILIAIVFGLASVEIVICIFWYILDPFRINYLFPEPNNYEKTVSYVQQCHSSADDIVLVILLGYNMTLQLCIVLIVYKLHNKIPKCHKHLQFRAAIKMAYILTFLHVFGIPTYAVAQYVLNDVTFEVIFLGITMELMQVFAICLILLPPVFPILRQILHQRNVSFY